MKGHEQLLAMRRRGYAVDAVWVNEGPMCDVLWRKWPESFGCGKHFFAQVCVEPNDTIEGLDMRFAIGLECFVHADDEAKGQRIVDALLAAGSRRVVNIRPDTFTVHKPEENACN